MPSEYPSALRELAKLALAIPALYVAFVLFGLGPLGWILLVGAVLVGGALWYDGSEREGPDRTNCPDCGAPNDADAEACSYCEAPL